MRSISRLCVVVLTDATERVDGIVEVGSAKVVDGVIVCNDNILPAAVAFAVDVDELNIQDGRDNLREKSTYRKKVQENPLLTAIEEIVDAKGG